MDTLGNCFLYPGGLSLNETEFTMTCTLREWRVYNLPIGVWINKLIYCLYDTYLYMGQKVKPLIYVATGEF